MARYEPRPFREILADVLKSENCSPEELSRRVGVSHYTFRHISTGRCKHPSYDTLVLLANYLDWPIENFFE